MQNELTLINYWNFAWSNLCDRSTLYFFFIDLVLVFVDVFDEEFIPMLLAFCKNLLSGILSVSNLLWRAVPSYLFSRKGCCYDKTLFSLYVDSILEDLVITLADGIASIYLGLISVDGNLSNEINSLGLVMCNLSTRALQRLRNEVEVISFPA